MEMGSTFSRTDNVDPHDNLTDSWFINLSETQISTMVAKTLSLGKNFGIPFSLSKLPTKHLRRFYRYIASQNKTFGAVDSRGS